MRKAALALAALGDADRAWMLEQLSPDQARRLRALLRELGRLKLAPDTEALRELTASAPEPAPEEGLHSASASRVLALVREEPDWAVAALLRAGRWPWREELLQALGAERRRAIDAVLGSGQEPRARALRAVREALESRLAAQAAP
jgi:hypothetical protein